MSDHDPTLELLAHLKSLRLAGVTYLPAAGSVLAEPDVEEAPISVATEPAATSRKPVEEEAAGRSRAAPPRTATPEFTLSSSPPAELPASDAPWPAPLSREERVEALAQLAKQVAECVLCGELARTRRQTVFGVGNPMPRLVLLGEAPGEEEDKRGEPFVGRAGQLLDKMIAACTLSRDQVYILNVLKCRPPGNRNPLPAEAAACRAFLDRQLEILRPEFILCLGAIAAKNLLSVELPVGRMRGRLFRYRGAKVVVTYHPSYLLRTESAKRDAWDDLKFLLREMGISLPPKNG